MSMREIDKYGVLKEKMQGICDEHNLTFSIQNRKYPFFMIVKPQGGMDAQQTMLEGMDEPGETGYISPDASLVFTYRDGALTYKISETFTISDTLFSKIKNLFNKMHALWTQHFFRDVTETSPGIADSVAGESRDEAEDTAEGEDAADEFAEFMAEAEPALADEETEDELPGDDAEDEE